MSLRIARTVIVDRSTKEEARLIITTSQGAFSCHLNGMSRIEIERESWTPAMHTAAEALCTHLRDAGYGHGRTSVEVSQVGAFILNTKPWVFAEGCDLVIELLHTPWKRDNGIIRLGKVADFTLS